jgi:hypothetical protein
MKKATHFTLMFRGPDLTEAFCKTFLPDLGIKGTHATIEDEHWTKMCNVTHETPISRMRWRRAVEKHNKRAPPPLQIHWAGASPEEDIQPQELFGHSTHAPQEAEYYLGLLPPRCRNSVFASTADLLYDVPTCDGVRCTLKYDGRTLIVAGPPVLLEAFNQDLRRVAVVLEGEDCYIVTNPDYKELTSVEAYTAISPEPEVCSMHVMHLTKEELHNLQLPTAGLTNHLQPLQGALQGCEVKELLQRRPSNVTILHSGTHLLLFKPKPESQALPYDRALGKVSAKEEALARAHADEAMAALLAEEDKPAQVPQARGRRRPKH